MYSVSLSLVDTFLCWKLRRWRQYVSGWHRLGRGVSPVPRSESYCSRLHPGLYGLFVFLLALKVGGVVELMRVVDYAFGVNIAVHCYFVTRSLRPPSEESSLLHAPTSASSVAGSSEEVISLERKGAVLEVEDLFPLFLFEDDDDGYEARDGRKTPEGCLSSVLGRFLFDVRKKTRKTGIRNGCKQISGTDSHNKEQGREKKEKPDISGDRVGSETDGEIEKERGRRREAQRKQHDVALSAEERREKFVGWVKSMMVELDQVPLDQLAVVKDLASKSLQCALAYCDKITSWKRCLNSPVSQFMQKYVLKSSAARRVSTAIPFFPYQYCLQSEVSLYIDMAVFAHV